MDSWRMTQQWQAQIDKLRKDPRLPVVLAGIFTLLLLSSVLSVIDTFATHHAKITAAKTGPVVERFQRLSDLHLFGVFAPSLDALPTTQLALSLEGTVVSLETPNESRALIAVPNMPAKVYQVGDKLPGNATITRIAKHYVVINDNGALGKLALPIQILKNDEGQ